MFTSLFYAKNSEISPIFNLNHLKLLGEGIGKVT